jgi:hypothetical protein
MIRVRFASSPYGSLHVRNALVAAATCTRGDVRALRVALTGRERPVLAATGGALDLDETSRRLDAAV